MTTTSRTRKTAAAEPAGEVVPAGNNEPPTPAVKKTNSPMPAAAPLEPPTEQEAPNQTADARAHRAAVADAIPSTPYGLIIDSATGQPPALDAVFEKVTPHGTSVISVARLVEHTADHHGRTMTTLLAARGAHLSGTAAAAIMQRLQDQADVRNAITD